MADFDVVRLPETDPVTVGETAPDFTRPLVNGEYWGDTPLSELTDDGPVLLAFHPIDQAFPTTYLWQELKARAWTGGGQDRWAVDLRSVHAQTAAQGPGHR